MCFIHWIQINMPLRLATAKNKGQLRAAMPYLTKLSIMRVNVDS